jgi:hypothetical protein
MPKPMTVMVPEPEPNSDGEMACSHRCPFHEFAGGGNGPTWRCHWGLQEFKTMMPGPGCPQHRPERREEEEK